jgi:CDGSH-type Zn-finger protein
MEPPRNSATGPIPVDVEEGKTYWWCACGLSKRQPFCDGSHKTTELEPKAWTAEKTGKVWFCACKQTDKVPLCDGSHKKFL